MSRILYIAYSLLPVTDRGAGGAEQVLASLERVMATRGTATTVAACKSSRVAGELLETGHPADELDQYPARERERDQLVLDHLRTFGRSYDLVHDHSGSFWRHAGELGMPVLATLHLPREFYPPERFEDCPKNLFYNCVSEAQWSSFADLPGNLGVVCNGIEIERFPFTPQKDNYLLWLGRICEEKGTHVAIEVGTQSGMPVVVAGQVYPFSYHQSYFENCIRPRLESGQSRVKLIEAPSFEQKLELLRHAKAVLITSQCAETSSLVALEAMACGTPVLAFRRGGLPELVAHDETGFIVDTVEQMVAGVSQVEEIDPFACRARVESLFTAKRMADDYERLYTRLVGQAKNATILSS